MKPVLWGLGTVIVILWMASACDGSEPPKGHLATRTVTVTAPTPPTPSPVMRTKTTVPEFCLDAADDGNKLYSALFQYERSVGLMSKVQDKAATGLAEKSIPQINASREILNRYLTISTDALQQISIWSSQLKTDNQLCRSQLRK
jgi:hypothetical protein